MDASGSSSLFIADTGNNVIRMVDLATGVITTVAASSGGVLSSPSGLAASSTTLYIADSGNSVVRALQLPVSGGSSLSIFVGTSGSPGSSGDGGPASAALLSSPAGLALDPTSGDLLIADSGSQRVRHVSATTGTIATVAGTGSAGSSGDGGLATSARLNHPSGIAVDSLGNVFIADSFSSAVRRIDAADGTLGTVAGTLGASGFSGDGGPATLAKVRRSPHLKLLMANSQS